LDISGHSASIPVARQSDSRSNGRCRGVVHADNAEIITTTKHTTNAEENKNMPYINDEAPGGARPGTPTPAQHPSPMTINGRIAPTPVASPTPAESTQTTVSQAFLAMTTAQKAHQKHLDELQRSEDQFSAEGYLAQVAAFTDTPAAKAVDQHEAAVIERRNQAAADYARTLKQLAPEGDTAQELRNGRSWDRHRHAIDNATSPVAAARAAVNKAEGAELKVLLDELPAHLGASGAPTDWINGAVEQRAPELAAARKALDNANQAVTVTQYDAARLREGFATGRPPVTLVSPVPFDPDR
jgi:hypothetical protein